MVMWRMGELKLTWSGVSLHFRAPDISGRVYLTDDGLFKICRLTSALIDGKEVEIFVIEAILSAEDTALYLEALSRNAFLKGGNTEWQAQE